jgi:hypothetical protein
MFLFKYFGFPVSIIPPTLHANSIMYYRILVLKMFTVSLITHFKKRKALHTIYRVSLNNIFQLIFY